MRITIIGTGYVGLTSGVCLAEMGHTVTCMDIDQEKIDRLNSGEIPIYEQGLSELLVKNTAADRLIFTTDVSRAMGDAALVFFCVDTPPGEYGKADLSNLLRAVEVCARYGADGVVFVNKSTAPVGTVAKIREVITRVNPAIHASVASNPEFLSEGSAVREFMAPDRIIIGIEDERSHTLLHECYEPLTDRGVPLMVTTIPNAELIKYASNSFLALKISFINEIADFCEHIGADVEEIAKGIGLDRRIGSHFFRAGIGYGGSCFGKDVRALAVAGEERGFEFKIVKALSTVNELRYLIVIKKLQKYLGELKKKRIAVLGLSYKPGTDDVRDAPSLRIVHELIDAGATVSVYDPVANEKFKQHSRKNGSVMYGADAYETAREADALIILTEWDEFKNLDLLRLKSVMSNGLIIDGRNIFNRQSAQRAGFSYEGIGR